MEMSFSGLFLNLLVSSVGFGFFIYGKKQHRAAPLAGGVLLMIYPYFVSNVLLMAGIGVAIVAGIVLASRIDY